MNPKTNEAYKLFHFGTIAFSEAELQGINIDIEKANIKYSELTTKIKNLEQKLFDSPFYKEWEKFSLKKINYNSPDQLGTFLYSHKKIKPKKTTTSGKGSTDEDSLQALNIPGLNIIINIKKQKKLRDTYLKGFTRVAVKNKIHPSLNLHTVSTYRSSCNNPNFQNLPSRDKEAMNLVKGIIIPSKGNQLLEADYKSLEVNIGACYHKDPNMIKYCTNKDNDMHRDVCQQIFNVPVNDKSFSYLRKATKNSFVFPQFYGDYYKNNAYDFLQWTNLPDSKWVKGQGIELNEGHLSDHLIKQGITGINPFIKHLQKIENDFWEKKFKIYQIWKDRMWRSYKSKGYIDMKTGFRCSGILEYNQIANYSIQGSAFHCLLWSFIELSRILKCQNWKSKIIGQIHDSIIFDVNPDELHNLINLIKRVTCQDLPQHWPWINVPLTVEFELSGIDKPWSEKKEIDV